MEEPDVKNIFDLAGSGEAWGFSGGVLGKGAVVFEGMKTDHYPEYKNSEGGTGSAGGGIGYPVVQSFITQTNLRTFSEAEITFVEKYLNKGFSTLYPKKRDIYVNRQTQKSSAVPRHNETNDFFVKKGYVKFQKFKCPGKHSLGLVPVLNWLKTNFYYSTFYTIFVVLIE